MSGFCGCSAINARHCDKATDNGHGKWCACSCHAHFEAGRADAMEAAEQRDLYEDSDDEDDREALSPSEQAYLSYNG